MVEQADSWLGSKEAFLNNDDLGVSYYFKFSCILLDNNKLRKRPEISYLIHCH